MKQIGNLAIVCAKRNDVTLRIEQGDGNGLAGRHLCADSVFCRVG